MGTEVYFTDTATGNPASQITSYTFVDADAEAAYNAVVVNGGDWSDTEKEAFDNFAISLKASSLWMKGVACYPQLGGTSSSMAINCKNPGTFDVTWVNTVSGDFASTGWTPNGSTSYGRTGIIPSTHLTANDIYIAEYCRGTSTGAYSGWGSNESSAKRFVFHRKRADTKILFDCYNTSTSRIITAHSNPVGGLYFARKTTSGLMTCGYGATNVDNKTNIGGTVPTIEIWIGATNFNGVRTTADVNENALFWFGSYFDNTDMLNFKSAVDTFQTALGRNV